jgi:putative ABC transport system permease protein
MRLDEIKYALENLKHRPLRSFLSVLSILIGISAIFALTSFGFGIQNYVNTLAAESGLDKLFIQAQGTGAPGTDSNFYISQDDVDFVEKINGVADIAPLYMKPAAIKFKEETRYNYLMGSDIHKLRFVEETMNLKLYSGRKVKTGETDKVMLGYNYQLPKKIFTRPVKLGDKINVNDADFTVVGFYKEVGNPQDDGNIYMANEAIEKLFPETVGKYGFVILRSQPDITTNALADTIMEKLRKHKGQEEGKEDFYVMTFEDAIATFQIILNVINGILILIALVSVIVAAVNIMNTMYTAVMERTNEIGIMKAVGARNNDILFIFIFESGLLGITGGAIGVILGYIVATTGGAIAAGAGYALLKPIFPWTLSAGCILFAFLVGAGAGVMPAFRASRLKPVEALRYE